MHKLFMNKTNRNTYYQHCIAMRLKVRKSSTRNQLLHPMYVQDYEQVTGISLTKEDCGFGNTIYKTHFAVLYSVEDK